MSLNRTSTALAVLALSALVSLPGCGRRGLPEAPAATTPSDAPGTSSDAPRRKPDRKTEDDPFFLDFLL